MKLRPAGWMSWQVGALLALGMLCGAALGAVVASSIYLDEAGKIAREMNRKSTRIHLLELLVQQQMPDTSASLEAAARPEVAASPAASASAPAVKAPAAAPPIQQPGHLAVGRGVALPPDRIRERAAIQSKRAAPTNAAVAAVSDSRNPPRAPVPAATVASAASSPSAASLAQLVTGEELMRALSGRIEGVPAAKAGVKSIDSTGVSLLNGGRVRVGQFFPSGEKLLQVDPDSSRVVTNKRQLLLFFPQ